MSLDPGWVNNINNPYKSNRYEVFFDSSLTLLEEDANCLRLSCHTVQEISEDTVKFVFHDFEGNKEYNALKLLVTKNAGKHITIPVVCYDGKHEIYERISITGILTTEPVLDFSWFSGNSARNLVLYLSSVKIESVRY